MKKVRRLRQAVTVLLCAAMLVTSVPQTGAVALAAEEEEIQKDAEPSAEKQDISKETDKENNENNSQTVPSDEQGNNGTENSDAFDGSDGQNGTATGSENEGGDENTQPGSSEDEETADDDEEISDTPDENPEENPDGDQDVENGEETEEDADDITDVPEDNGEGAVEDESVSMNSLGISANEVEALDVEEVPEWLGNDYNNFLYIGYRDGYPEKHITKEGVASILEYYAGKGRKFDEIQIDMSYVSDGNDMSIDPEIINPAVDVLTGKGGLSLNYEVEKENNIEQIDYFLRGLYKCDKKVQTSIEATPVAGQGIKVKYTRDGDIPATGVTLEWSKDGVAWDSCLGEKVNGYSDLAVFRYEGGTLLDRNENCYAFHKKDEWTNDDGTLGVGESLNIDRIYSLESGAEYLITPLYNDAEEYGEETLSVDSERALRAGIRSGSYVAGNAATWTSMNPEVATIDENGIMHAVALGVAYYSVTYISGGNQYLEVHHVKVTADANGTTLEYVGETWEESDGRHLSIDTGILYDRKNRFLTDTEIAAIMRYYADRGQSFDRIYVQMYNPKSFVINAGVANAAGQILTEDGALELAFFCYGYIRGYTLSHLGNFTKNITLTYTETPLANQGVKVKFGASGAIPAESVYFYSHVWDESKFAKYDNSLGIENGNPAIFKLQSGNPTVKVNEEACGAEYIAVVGEGETPGRKIDVFDLNALQLNTEYLLTFVYEDEAVAAGSTKQLTAGERSGSDKVSGVTWKSLDEDIASIDKNGLLTAWEPGETYYYVKYKLGSATYLEAHKVNIIERDVQIAFDETQIDMELWDENPEQRYLRLRFYPSDAECDPGNPEEILWETSNANVVSLVKYNEQGEETEGGNPNGELRAVGEGSATITASYLRDTDDDGTKEKIVSASCTVTVTKPLTWEDVKDQVEAMDLYAVTNLDTKLSDIAIQKDGTTLEGWAWQEPDTSLANFKSMDGHDFPAIYTDPVTGQSIKCNLWVRMVTVTGVTIMSRNQGAQENEPEWVEWVPDSLVTGESITLARGYVIENLNGENEQEYQAIRERMDARYSIEWTSSPKNAGRAENNIYQYTASIAGAKQKAEKKTFTVSMKDNKKVIFKASCTITVTVNPTYDFDLVEGPWTETDEKGQMWLCLKVQMPVEEYQKQKLTIASEDTSILTLTSNKTVLEEAEEQNEDNGKTYTYTYVKIPCKNPKPGTAWIKMTAPDEMKSFRRDSIEFVDKEPKLVDTTAVTINKLLTDKSASVVVRAHEDWPVDTSKTSLLLNMKATESLKMQIAEIGPDAGNGYHDYRITLSLTEQASTDKNLKNGKNMVGLKLTVKPQDTASEETPVEYTLNLTMNVNSTKPGVSFKQTGKVNLFYNDEEGYGVLNVNTNGAQIQNLRLENYEDKNPKKNTVCDFELKEGAEPGTYYIALKENGNAKNKKGLLKYEVEGYEGTWQTTFTVASETKKPTVVLSAKTDSLYPNIGYQDSWLTMKDKATGECIEAESARYVVNKKKNQYTPLNVSDFSDQNDKETLISGNNSFNLLVTPDGNIVSRLQGTDAENPSYSKKTDKFNLEIKEANWNDWIAVSYSLKVETSKPKLALGGSTLTLNKNNEVYRAQMARTSLRLKGCSNNVMQDEWSWVSITGQDEKSKKVLKADNSLVLQYWSNEGDIIVRFNNNKIDTGKYKFKITVGNDDAGEIASSVLTVNVVDQAVDKTLKVTAKGSIDVLDREGTCITYTPKLSNLTGVIEDGWLEGRDADLFDAWMEDGKLVVHAKVGVAYSTKNSYQVNAVFRVQTQDYDDYKIRTAKPLTIKLKQGKPKLKASAANNTLYRQLDNTVEIKLDAVLDKKEVEIEDVWLLNYTEDLELRTTKIQADSEDNSGEPYYDVIYNPETKSVTLAWCDRYNANSIVQSGKTWKVKLAVRYRDKAGNEKNAEVTCPIVVR